MKNLLLIFTLLIFITSCGGGDGGYNDRANVSSPQMDFDMGEGESSAPLQDRKLVKEGSIDIRAKNDLRTVKAFVDSLMRKYGGYYGSEGFGPVRNYDDWRTDSYYDAYDLRAKIPSQNFDMFLADLNGCGGTIQSVSVWTTDVTDRYIDYQMRLSSKKVYLDRYRELVKRAATLKEVLEIEETVRKIEEEIESTEARLKDLQGQIAYSSLHITISSEMSAAKTGSSFPGRAARAFRGGWSFLKSVVIGMVYIWPVYVITAGTLLGITLHRKRRKARRPS